MAVTKVQDITNIGTIAGGDKLVGERVDGTTVRFNYGVDITLDTAPVLGGNLGMGGFNISSPVLSGPTSISGNTTVTGTFDVTGNSSITGTLSTTGLSTLNSLAVTNNATVGGTLGVTGVATLSSNATVGGTLGVTGVATLSSNATVGGTLGVTGTTTITGNLRLNSNDIKDSNNNTILSLIPISNAVNYVSFVNNSTGAPVAFVASGSDSNINLQFNPKGTGIYEFYSEATSNQIKFYTGTSYAHTNTLSFPSSAASTTYTFPDASGTLLLSGGALGTPSSGTLTNCTGLPESGITGSSWTFFSPGFTGFSAAPTPVSHYKKVGRIVYVQISMIAGTSNSTSFTITGLPFTSFDGHTQPIPVVKAENNGAFTGNASATLASNSTTLTLELSGSSTGWTSSSTKGATLSFFYESAS